MKEQLFKIASKLGGLGSVLSFIIINGIVIALFMIYLINPILSVSWTLFYIIGVVLCFVVSIVVFFVNLANKKSTLLSRNFIISLGFAWLLMLVLNMAADSVYMNRRNALISYKDDPEIAIYVDSLENYKKNNNKYPDNLNQLEQVSNFSKVSLPKHVTINYNLDSNGDYEMKISQQEASFLFDGCGAHTASIIKTSSKSKIDKIRERDIFYGRESIFNGNWYLNLEYPPCM